MRIGMMGFGQVGRQLYQLALEDERFDIVAVSDIGRPEILHHLLARSLGRGGGAVRLQGNHLLGRLDGRAVGSIQLVKPAPAHEAGRFAASIDAHFVAPSARGHGLARMLLDAAEDSARRQGYSVMRLDVRETQERAIRLYESRGYERWGTLDRYHRVEGAMIAGHFYIKDLA